MMGEEGKPLKKVRLRGRGKRPDRPPENPVVDVCAQQVVFFSVFGFGKRRSNRHVHFSFQLVFFPLAETNCGCSITPFFMF